LVGPYANALATANGIAVTRTNARTAATTTPLDAETIRTLLDRSHHQVLSLLRSVQTWKGEAGLAKSMVDAGLVVGVIDTDSSLGFAPVSNPNLNLRLVDRVRSLFVADYLTRPAEYETFRVCQACEGATFDPNHGECVPPASSSTDRLSTLVGLGELVA